jgi:tetratricopeptide (TPR) repeat protein
MCIIARQINVMTDWYRNAEWSPTIADEFETRLARARTQKAQYLTLQGIALIPAHPGVAADLLQRAAAMGDSFDRVRALAALAQARLALGDPEGALEAYEAALELQVAQPQMIAAQPADYLFVIGYFGSLGRLSGALLMADAMPNEGIFGPDPQILAAKAMVFDLAGLTAKARAAAADALPLFERLGDAEALGVSLADVRCRLAGIVERAA